MLKNVQEITVEDVGKVVADRKGQQFTITHVSKEGVFPVHLSDGSRRTFKGRYINEYYDNIRDVVEIDIGGFDVG